MLFDKMSMRQFTKNDFLLRSDEKKIKWESTVIPYYLPHTFIKIYLKNTTAIPIHKKGPSAKQSFRFARFVISRKNPYNPPKSNPAQAANIFHFIPSNTPLAAISLTSPPPSPPEHKIASMNIGILTENTPKKRLKNVTSWKTKVHLTDSELS